MRGDGVMSTGLLKPRCRVHSSYLGAVLASVVAGLPTFARRTPTRDIWLRPTSRRQATAMLVIGKPDALLTEQPRT